MGRVAVDPEDPPDAGDDVATTPRPDLGAAPSPDPFDYQQGMASSANFVVRSTLQGWAVSALIAVVFVVVLVVIALIYFAS